MTNQTIKVLQVGMGPLGVAIAKQIQKRSNVVTVGAIDIRSDLQGKTLFDLDQELESSVVIEADAQQCQKRVKADVIVLTTVSDMERIFSQIESLAPLGMDIVSTCEELSYPWKADALLASKIDAVAKEFGIKVLGTGINPGFLMDALPLTVSSVCQRIDHVTVTRVQNASHRRLPFQQKIGAGLDVSTFEQKVKSKEIRHVGLAQSIEMIAQRFGWSLDKVSDEVTPVVATQDCGSKEIRVRKGQAQGVRQIGQGFVGSTEKIRMEFLAVVDASEESYDEVSIQGDLMIQSRIQGGVQGDQGTCSVILNSIPSLLACESAGLKTMIDIPLVSFRS
ncbi:MAG: hypothetical protein R3A11_10185 [Bdellovibrionota bacterium]